MRKLFKLLAAAAVVMITLLSCSKKTESTQTAPLPANTPQQTNRPVRPVNALPIGKLSQARVQMAGATVGHKILFAGGFIPGSGPSGRVDIFDINTGEWSTAELSVPRHNMGVAVAGNKIFFAGGSEGGWWDYGEMFSNVDIYDASTNSWSVMHLGEATGWVSATTSGNRVFFAGGVNNIYIDSRNIDIYDMDSKLWTTMTFSKGKSSVHINAWNDKIYFAGGAESEKGGTMCSNKIEIYDVSTGQWTASLLSETKLQMQSVVHGNKIIWAGGVTETRTGSKASAKVEIRDLVSGSTTIASLSKPNFWDHFNQIPTVIGNKVLFYQGCYRTAFDILDMSTGEWEVGLLNKDISGATSVSANKSVYLAGGYLDGVLSDKVWILDL